MATLHSIKELSAFHLCGKEYADCYSPDSIESAGASFLTSVRDAVIEAIEYGSIDPSADEDTWNHSGQIDTIADNAPDVYTYQRWQEFVDLGAFNEEPESGEWPDDLTSAAGVALYQIAERLAYALLRELAEGSDDDDEESDDAGEDNE